LIEIARVGLARASVSLLEARQALERHTREWTETIGEDNAFKLIDWLEQHEWHAPLGALTDFILSGAPAGLDGDRGA
jgi:hypothetical protein